MIRATAHQFHSGTAAGDAVTQSMFEIQQYLRDLGYASDNVLIIHHSMGHGAFERVLRLPDRMLTVYHNITPERYLTDESNRRHARIGRDQLRVLAGRSEGGIAVSNFNRRDMLDAGFR